MSANFKELMKFSDKIQKLNDVQKEEFLQACAKELAARLLAKVIKRTPVGDYSGSPYTCVGGQSHKGSKKSGMTGGTLRRGWTAGKNQNASAYANSLAIKRSGDKYIIDIINPVEYASYVEYGHRTRNHAGWVQGHYMLTISETELNNMSDAILQKKLNKFLKDVCK